MRPTWRDLWKFLSGALFVSSGVLAYLWLTGTSVPLIGTGLVATPEVSGVRAILNGVFFLVTFYLGFIRRGASQ